MGLSSHKELYLETENLAPLFRCVGDETRMRILTLLSDNGPMNVTQITEQIDLSRPAVSHHLQQLKQAGFVAVQKNGNERYYQVRFLAFLNRVEEWVNRFKTECTHLE